MMVLIKLNNTVSENICSKRIGALVYSASYLNYYLKTWSDFITDLSGIGISYTEVNHKCHNHKHIEAL